MSQYRNGIPLTESRFADSRNGESESMLMDPQSTETHHKFTSTRDCQAYRRWVARAAFEAEMRK
jgi:hypothetical protein